MKIPTNAKRVFKGIIFDVYHWQQQMYDGNLATFEMLKRPGTIQIIPTIGDQIVLSYEEQPTKPLGYSFLGGRQEENEEPLVTAKRELLEEAGLESNDWQLYKTYEFPGKIDHTSYFFIARNCQKVAEPNLDAGEKIEVKSVSFDEFVEQALSEEFLTTPHFVIDLFRMKDRGRLEKLRQTLFP